MCVLIKLQDSLRKMGRHVDTSKIWQEITHENSLQMLPEEPGVYWIETTMPVSEIQNESGKRDRRSIPQGCIFIEQQAANPYIIYIGTENNIRRRIGQHLFNQGNEGTAKLGFEVNKQPYTNYTWRVAYKLIGDHVVRYAMENWLRRNKGWPKFCLK